MIVIKQMLNKKLVNYSKCLIKSTTYLASVSLIGYKYWSQNNVKTLKPLVTINNQRVCDFGLRRAHLNGHKTIDDIIKEIRTSFVIIFDNSMGTSDELMEIGFGSGMFVDPRGYILTNSHVTEESPLLDVVPFISLRKDGVSSVEFNKDICLMGHLVYAEPNIDLALFRIDDDLPVGISVVTFSDDVLEVGEQVMALGNPEIDYTVCDGIVTNLQSKANAWSMGTHMYYINMVDPNHGFVSSTSPISSGYSGGPLLNKSGQVVAIDFASTEVIIECYSTLAAEAKEFIKRGMNFERIDTESRYLANKTNKLGIGVQNYNHNFRQDIHKIPGMQNFANHLNRYDEGVIVWCLLDTPDDSQPNNSLQVFDIIIDINSNLVKDIDDLKKIIKGTDDNKEMVITVWRNTSQKVLTFKPKLINRSVI